MALDCVFDFTFNAQTRTYEPIDVAKNELSDVAYSGYLDLSAAIAMLTVVTDTFSESPTLTADASVLLCTGKVLYQQLGPNYYLSNSDNALKVADIF